MTGLIALNLVRNRGRTALTASGTGRESTVTTIAVVLQPTASADSVKAEFARTLPGTTTAPSAMRTRRSAPESTAGR